MPNTKASNTAAKFPSFNWMRGVSDDKRISVIYRFILVRLCMHRDEKNGGQCNPGYQTVADELGVYRTTVLKAVDAAVRLGWLGPPIRTRRANASFVFTFPDQEVATGATSKPDQEVAGQQHQENQEVAPGELRSRSERVKKSLAERGSPAASKTSKRNGQRERAKKNGQKNIYQPSDFASPDSKEDAPPKPDHKKSGDDNNVTRLSDSEIDSAFDEFWASCPRQDAPEKARRTYRMVVVKRGVAPGVINAAMKVYGSQRAGQDLYWTMKPANWLNDGCYASVQATAGGPPTIDQDGNEIAEPQPRRWQRPETHEEMVERLVAEAEQQQRERNS